MLVNILNMNATKSLALLALTWHLVSIRCDWSFSGLPRDYLGRCLGSYLGYGIPKGYLRGYIELTCRAS
jgi:hypothetical protein